MSNGKSPGPDGFPTEFYKFFWTDIGKYYIRSLNLAFEKGELSTTQKQGVITCLPKGNKPREFLKNWRPITLLNVDYKLVSACLAARMKRVLPDIVGESQKGFLKGRFIGENTRIVYDLIQYLNRNKKSGLLLLIDFEKAFDSINWKYLERALEHYNFGPMFIRWWKTIYKDSKSCVINNGHFSEFFQLGRGCRQGDPLSPYLFILAIEPLSMKIKLTRDCKGIKFGENTIKIGQYADDTFLLLDGSEKSLRTAISIFDRFRYVSGLKINPTKTKVIWIGSKAGSEEVLCPDKHFMWDSVFTFLGIEFDVKDINNITELNMKSKITDIKRLLRSYGRRTLTTIGKITVVKTLAIPKLIHIFTSLPEPSPRILNELNILFRTFIWHGKTPKVNKHLIIQDFTNGGLKMVDIQAQIHALKISWIKRLLTTDGDWQELFKTEHSEFPLWELDKRSLLTYSKSIHNQFWREVCRDWASLIDFPSTTSDFLATPIWNTFFITNCNLKKLKTSLIERGCIYIKHLVGENGRFLTRDEFNDKFNSNINFLNYQALILSIPRLWRQQIKRTTIAELNLDPDNQYITKLLHTPQPSKWAYLTFIKRLPFRDKSKPKWENIFGQDFTEGEWADINICANQCTIETKARMFQYKIIHRFLATNSYLTKVKIKDSALCDHCGNSAETLVHLFWECEYAQRIWTELKEWLMPFVDISVFLNAKNVILGTTLATNHRLTNHLILIAKWHIYASKYMQCKPGFNILERLIKKQYKVEKSIITSNDTLGVGLHKKWTLIMEVLDD